VAQALALQHVTAANASIGVTRAGTLPYFSDRVGVDFLGKADTRIAHEPSRVPGGARRFMDFRPGHSKWDDAYSIGELRPDVITQIWGDRQAASQYMSGYGRFRFGTDCAYARIDSPRIDVARLTPCAPAQ
jgi:hypothetical protein